MRISAIRLAAAGLLLTSAAAAGAQTRTAPPAATRAAQPFSGYLSLNAGAQVAREAFEPTRSFPLYREQARVETRYDTPAALVFDLGGGVRVWQQLGIGAAVTRFQEERAAIVEGALPHPIFLSQNRDLNDAVPDLTRIETAVHIHVAWLVPADDRVTVAVFGGPSLIRLEQDVITGLNLAESYPYDDVELESATQARREETALGFHAGADVMYRITKQVGVGAIARYSRSTATIATDDDEQADVTAGGLQLTAGLRWFF